MRKKVKCINCGEESIIKTDEPEENFKNIQCETCAKAPKEECDKRAKQNRIKYKDCFINIHSLKTRDGKNWVPDVDVEYHTGAQVINTPLYSKGVLSTEDDAREYGIGMAIKWIEEKYY